MDRGLSKIPGHGTPLLLDTKQSHALVELSRYVLSPVKCDKVEYSSQWLPALARWTIACWCRLPYISIPRASVKLILGHIMPVGVSNPGPRLSARVFACFKIFRRKDGLGGDIIPASSRSTVETRAPRYLIVVSNGSTRPSALLKSTRLTTQSY